MDMDLQTPVRISDVLAARFAENIGTSERSSGDSFRVTLNKLSDEGLAERLTILIGEISTCGKRLAEHMDFVDLRRYRGLVTDFINEVVTHSHQFSRENFLDRRGRHHVYGIVRLVNKELDALAQEFLKKEKNHMAILDSLEEIQGLLVNLMV